ncbi:PPK2 family polyphosphate kinase [Spirosoma utsteinense]|uniref:PPK2 family polyphosphate:nucleotide phosphotransferase n=1 Tax=Spirosoma utsteinense TaxID=2585773 RepID=A0ABR6W3T7_9BACT|nr:PPK2 family polyphosphate kinase [Spirosoma utsteinense]MBC3784758.1 PPK2 family polyphosphate:nucleotide phosphotransferase [Spirosoma utsteinense]MBC3791205.1 PPK2 family polyphosphate:nucleotide phosphotransferase [Spirosoma utsteinense]
MKDFDIDRFRYDGENSFKIKKAPTKVDDLYEDDVHYEALLRQQASEIDSWQERMFSQNRYGLVAVFQALDAAGKDGTIKAVFTGTNPTGVRVSSFKRPSEKELEHDFLWRSWRELPERGMIGVFNRSYYEEVLVTKVHPEILTESQRLPEKATDDLDKLFKHRYDAIRDMEKYLYRNGFSTVKFFLHISKKEQAERLISRIEDQEKNWKFEEGDVDEREHWDAYQDAYEAAVNETATENAPWYVIPADDKKNMRLLVGRILIHELKKLPITEPQPDDERFAELQKLISVIEGQ